MSDSKQYINSYSMVFSNSEIYEGLFQPFKNIFPQIKFFDESENEVDSHSEVPIEIMSFDDNEDLVIRFLGSETSIYFLEEQIMFIDETTKGIYTSSDTQDNIVYEGKLREMSHKEILEMFSNIILCFVDATGITVKTDTNNPVNHKYFSSYQYIINVENNHMEQNTLQIGNIVINY